MKKLVLAVFTLALLGVLLTTGAVLAQEPCFGDVTNYRACFVDDGLEITRIAEDGRGHQLGVVPTSVFEYAAASYDEARYVGRLTSPRDGSYVDLYFSYKVPQGQGFMTHWEMTLYNAAGVRLSGGSFEAGAAADASNPPRFIMPAAPDEDGETSTTTLAPAAPVGIEYEPTIVTGGTVNECLVRNTYTVRMRTAPTTGSAVLDNVPYDTSMPSDVRTTDGEWYRAFFVAEGGVGRLGWIAADYLEVSEACEDIAQAAPVSGPVAPAAAPAASSAAADDEDSTDAGADEAAADFDPTWNGQLDLTIVEPGTVNQCLVRNTFTVRIRVAPTMTAPVLDSVPFDSSMPADLRTTDGEWIRSNYVGSLGWISTNYLEQSAACADLPAINPLP
jgi:hypothetical protein